jgi:hypothetical protein
MASIPPNARTADRHGWNRYERYRQIHERVLSQDFPYLTPDSINITFEELETAGGEFWVHIYGWVYCPKGVVLEVEKYLETERRGPGRGTVYVRGVSYRYNAWIEGKHNILRYDNGHSLDDFHGHWYDLETGREIRQKALTRNEFPLMSEVLTELAGIVGFGEES